MPETSESLLAELQQILGITAEEVHELYLPTLETPEPGVAFPPIEWLRRKDALRQSYRNIVERARRDVQSAYDHLFHILGGARAPCTSVVEVFVEVAKALNPRPQLFEAVKAQFDELVDRQGFQSEGERYVPADGLVKVLEKVMRLSPASFYELARYLPTIIRLAEPLRNAIGWAIANGYQEDERKSAELNEEVEKIWIAHPRYWRVFDPEVRRRVLQVEGSIPEMAALIFSSDDMGERAAWTVETATRLESPAREEALGILAHALAAHIIYSCGSGEEGVGATYNKLWSLKNYAIPRLFSQEKVTRLNDWMATARVLLTAGSGIFLDQGSGPFAPLAHKDFESQLKQLTERLTKLESIVSENEKVEDMRRQLGSLVKNLLLFMRHETTYPSARWMDTATGVIGNYCELLWQDSVDGAFGSWSARDNYDEWQWLKLHRNVTELALVLQEGFRWTHRWRDKPLSFA